MIDLSKKYTTRDGREVDLWKIEDNRVFGTYKHPSKISYMCIWDTNGYNTGISYPSPLDLIEKKVTHKRTYYLAVNRFDDVCLYKDIDDIENREWKATKRIEVSITEGEFIE